MKINDLFKTKHHGEERFGKDHHKFELNAGQIQNEQEFQSEQDLDDLKVFESNKNKVTFEIVSA